MVHIYWVKKPPEKVSRYWKVIFPKDDGYSYKFYFYRSGDKKTNPKVWSAEVSKNGKFYDNSHQLTEADIESRERSWSSRKHGVLI